MSLGPKWLVLLLTLPQPPHTHISRIDPRGALEDLHTPHPLSQFLFTVHLTASSLY